MRNFHFVFLILFFFWGNSIAQNPFHEDLMAKKAPCFLKSLERQGKRYVDWECGEAKGVIDCLEKLESNPGSQVVYLKQSGRPFTGTCEMCHQNGIKQIVTQFENGLPHGIDTSYYESGCVQVIRNHNYGREDGKWIYYNDSSGLTAWEINYSNGEKHGSSVFYRPVKTGNRTWDNESGEKVYYATYLNDTIKYENYINGIPHGIKKEYYWPGSKLKKEVNYKNGVFHGPFIEYDPEGNKLIDAFYKEGKKEGEWKYFYNDGTLLKTENWKNGAEEGEFKTFFIEGQIQVLETYKKGLKNGQFLEYFSDYKLKREAFYKNDVLIEEHVFDKHGNETKTFGATPKKDQEDDKLPSTKKEKKKKEKTSKENKEES